MRLKLAARGDQGMDLSSGLLFASVRALDVGRRASLWNSCGRVADASTRYDRLVARRCPPGAAAPTCYHGRSRPRQRWCLSWRVFGSIWGSFSARRWPASWWHVQTHSPPCDLTP